MDREESKEMMIEGEERLEKTKKKMPPPPPFERQRERERGGRERTEEKRKRVVAASVKIPSAVGPRENVLLRAECVFSFIRANLVS